MPRLVRPFADQRQLQRFGRDPCPLAVALPGRPVFNHRSNGFDLGKPSFAGIELRANLRVLQGAIPDTHPFNLAGQPIAVIILAVRPDHERPVSRHRNRPRLFLSLSDSLAVDKQLLPLTVIGPVDEIPESCIELARGGQVGQLGRSLAIERKEELLIAIAEQPPLLIVAIVLQRAHNSAPGKWFIDPHPSRDGDRRSRQS